MFVRSMSHLRRHVIAYVALFIVLGGTAIALPGKGTVTSNDIAKGAVKSKSLAKQAVKSKNLAKKAVKTNRIANAAVTTGKLGDGAATTGKIADGAVTSAKIADGAVGGAQADEASFEGVIKGDGRQSTVSFTENAVGFLPTPRILAEVPGMGVIQFIACFPETSAGAADIRTRALSFDDSQPFFAAGTVIGSASPAGTAPGTTSDQDAALLSSGGGFPLIAQQQDPTGTHLGVAGWWDWTLSQGSGDDTVAAHVSVSGLNTSTNPTNGQCTVTATVQYQD